ncbi:MAG: transcription-repair coupling factor [Bacteroidales bacterium]|nr:transcription-repair coupling factor [Bacteroidales bacterium]
MTLEAIIHKTERHPNFAAFINSLSSVKKRFALKGLAGSSGSVFTSAVIRRIKGIHLFILPEKDDAAYYYNDLVSLLGEHNILFFPSSYKRSVQYGQPDNANIILRTEVLNTTGSFIQAHPDTGNCLIIITYPEALVEKVITYKKLQKNTLYLTIHDKISIGFITEVLEEYKFERTDFVYEPGQYAVRGGIVDIFSYADKKPYRIDFFGNDIESIRTFDIETQVSDSQLEKIIILPDVRELSLEDARVSFLDYFPTSGMIWLSDTGYIADRITGIFENTRADTDEQGTGPLPKQENLITGSYFKEKLDHFRTIEVGPGFFFAPDAEFEFKTALQPAFNKNFDMLVKYLHKTRSENYTNYILSDSEKQIERLASIFSEIDEHVAFTPVLKTLHKGYIDHTLKICCFSDHQIFERYHKYTLNTYFSRKAALSIRELTGLKPGDYIVHIDHGIGRFGGLEKIEVNGRFQEAVRLVYKDNDMLYVSIYSLHRISKYKGKDDAPPKIYKLGSGAWQRLKRSTKKKIKDIAKDLIALYAKRKTVEGFRFSPDTYLQNELEASFFFEDTPDQIAATIAVKEDMESKCPMDRLICGDVGFGKTEVAIRAAFKAVTDSKQAAILVPTTILALQHYNTFQERLKDFPCNIEYISRFKSAKEQKQIILNTENGKTDILIGTHRLLGKDIRFKDLGLLIIDEEQKFGVASKEKLRTLKENVDTLTLSATPIPRTLQFSLMGSRDLSVINTPPPNRQPIVTELHTFNEDIIREGIEFEVGRGGQVFFIHNRIENINDIEKLIRKLCPKVSTVVAHGQMEGHTLEKTMMGFVNADYDVLVATAIIESGLDIPNTNTIFVNNAHQFGLSDLHQLRGRVGRSNKKAFCYLLSPPMSYVSSEARRRLKAIEEFSDLGSGFNIALQDLDIRGAGNLLGAEQSGFIADIGFEAYNRILTEAIRELKENEYADVFLQEKEHEKATVNNKYTDDCQIDTDFELLFPENYISNVSERIHLYRRLDDIESEDEIREFQRHLEDRFGPLPEQSVELLMIVRLRWIAAKLGIEKIVMRNRLLIAYFISDQSSYFYQSELFGKILSFIQKQPSQFKMKEGNKKLTLTVNNINSVYDAMNILDKIYNSGYHDCE